MSDDQAIGAKSLLLALCLWWPSHSYGASGTEGAAFLDIPVGAGPAALGSAYSALATDAYAPVYNPAGLGFVTTTGVSAQHLAYLESMHYEFGSAVFPLQNHVSTTPKAIGAAIQYLGSGSIAGTDPSGNAAGDFSIHYAAYSLAYGQQVMDRLSLGVTGKVIEGKIAEASALAYALDFGALYRASEGLDVSATVNNLGNKLTFDDQGDALPLAFHVGAAYQGIKHWKSSIESVYSKAGLWSGRVGVEWSPLRAISLRTGFKSDTIKELTPLAGLTVGLGIHFLGQEFSYAWLPYGDLGNTQYFSLLLRFSKDPEARRNLMQSEPRKIDRMVRKAREGGRGDPPSLRAETDPEMIQWVSADDLQVVHGRHE